MIDPSDVTKYDRTDTELEEFLLFCILVAGKKATTTAANLDRLLKHLHDRHQLINWQPMGSFRRMSLHDIYELLPQFGIGSYNLKSKAIYYICNAYLDLRTCTREELVCCPGIGWKTASYFLLHSRKDLRIACLDRHILRRMRKMGCDVPEHTPPRNQYKRVERLFLDICEDLEVEPSTLDLQWWNDAQDLKHRNNSREVHSSQAGAA